MGGIFNPGIQRGTNEGAGQNVLDTTNSTSSTLVFKSLTSTDASVTITNTSDTVDFSASGGGSSTFAGLTDVNFTSLTDKDLAQYDSGTSKWVNKSISTAGFATVATTGAYSDLSGTPSIPTQYTDEMAQDAVGTILTDTATIDFTYNDAGNSITADVKDTSITYAKIQNVSATSTILGRNSAGAGSIEELSAATTKTLLSLNNVENTALSTWAGSTNITTLGTIGTGTWQGTAIGFSYLTGVQASDSTLTSLAAYNTNGLLTQTATDTFTGRTITGTANRTTITNGDGVSGNPTVDIHASYVGQNTITTLGTITTGTWNATKLVEAYGGTNQSTYTTGDILYASASNTLSKLGVGANPDGYVLTLASGIPSWAAASGGGGGLTPLFLPTTGQFYQATPPYIGWSLNSASVAGKQSAFNASVIFSPVYIPKAMTVVSYQIWCSAALGGSSVTIGIYADSGGFAPTGNALGVTSISTNSGTGTKTSGAISLALSADTWYWMGFQSSSATTLNYAVATCASGQLPQLWQPSSGFTGITNFGTIQHYSQTNTYSSGTLPTVSSPTAITVQAVIPAILLGT